MKKAVELDALARWALEKEAEKPEAIFTPTPEEENTMKEGEMLLDLRKAPGWDVFTRLIDERIEFLKGALEDEGRSFAHYKAIQQAINIYRGIYGLVQSRINEAENLKLLSKGQLSEEDSPIDNT